MRALRFVPIKKKIDRRSCSRPLRPCWPDWKCVYGCDCSQWIVHVLIDWKPDRSPMRMCDQHKKKWEQLAIDAGEPIIPPNVEIKRLTD